MAWPDDHFAAHPYYLKGIAEERARIVELIEKSFPEEFRGYRGNIIELITGRPQ